jgi:CubicO group peptidase (beta-lactamase class C family)
MPGISVSWSYQGHTGNLTIGERRYGTNEQITQNTIFQGGSVSKTAFTALVMKLHDLGLIDLFADVNQYLKTYHLDNVGSEKISLHMLLSHMAGTNVHGFEGYPLGTNMNLKDVLLGKGNSAKVLVDLTPNQHWRYSGGGYVVAQLAIEEHFGSTSDKLAEEFLFAPLNMTNSTFEHPLPESLRNRVAYGCTVDYLPVPSGYHFYPELSAAGLWSTPSDLLKLAIELRTSFLLGGYLSQKTARIMMSTVSPGRCVGIFLNPQSAEFFHSGVNAGFESWFSFDLERDFTITIMTNGNSGLTLCNAIHDTVKNNLNSHLTYHSDQSIRDIIT